MVYQFHRIGRERNPVLLYEKKVLYNRIPIELHHDEIFTFFKDVRNLLNFIPGSSILIESSRVKLNYDDFLINYHAS